MCYILYTTLVVKSLEIFTPHNCSDVAVLEIEEEIVQCVWQCRVDVINNQHLMIK